MAAFCGVRSGGSDGYPVAQDPGFLAGDLVFYRSFAGRSVSGRDGSLRGAGGSSKFKHCVTSFEKIHLIL